MNHNAVIPQTSDPFLDEGHARVAALREAILTTLASVSGDIEQPQEMSRRFGLDKTLAWKLSRLVTESDALSAVIRAPRLPGLQLFERAMAKHGAAPSALSSLRIAIVQFEAFVAEHAGDRDVMEIIVTSANERVGAKRLEQFRKSGFVSNSALLGVSTKTHYALRIVIPSTRKPDFFDLVTVSAFFGFRRLRPDVPWTVSTLSQWQIKNVVGVEPLSELHANTNIPFLEQFCSKPLPAMRAIREENGKTRFVLDPGLVGNSAAADVVIGWKHAASAPVRESRPGEQGEHGVLLATPAETMLHDLFIHESLDFAMSPTVDMYSMMPNGPGYPASAMQPQALPVHAVIERVDASTQTPEVPNFASLLAMTASQLNVDASVLRGFRARVKHPPIPAMNVFRHALRPRD